MDTITFVGLVGAIITILLGIGTFVYFALKDPRMAKRVIVITSTIVVVIVLLAAFTLHQLNPSAPTATLRSPTSGTNVSATASPTTNPAASASTATAAAFFSVPYLAPHPGKCDTGGAVWQSPLQGTVTCTNTAMRLDTTGVNSSSDSLVHFDGPSDRTFPAQYTVSIQATGLSPSWCVALHIDATDTSVLTVCRGGVNSPCTVYSQDTSQHRPCEIANHPSHVLKVGYQAGRTLFWVDGIEVDSVANSSGRAPQTASIEFGNTFFADGIVDFQDFVFTPTP